MCLPLAVPFVCNERDLLALRGLKPYSSGIASAVRWSLLVTPGLHPGVCLKRSCSREMQFNDAAQFKLTCGTTLSPPVVATRLRFFRFRSHLGERWVCSQGTYSSITHFWISSVCRAWWDQHKTKEERQEYRMIELYTGLIFSGIFFNRVMVDFPLQQQHSCCGNPLKRKEKRKLKFPRRHETHRRTVVVRTDYSCSAPIQQHESFG